MSDTPRAAALLAQVARGLVRHGREETVRTLGDRRTYIGLSDVGRAITCMRAAVLNKIGDKPTRPQNQPPLTFSNGLSALGMKSSFMGRLVCSMPIGTSRYSLPRA